MVVDTHVARISRRLGLTTSKDAVKIEFDLMRIVPKRSWNDFSLQLIFFRPGNLLGPQSEVSGMPAAKMCPGRRRPPNQAPVDAEANKYPP